MTGPATPPTGDQPPRGKDLYHHGPWLIVHGHGLESETRARQIAEQCEAREVDYEPATADDVRLQNLGFYFGLIVVMPSASAGSHPKSRGQLVETIRTYRAHRRDGLSALIAQRRRWFEVGVVQVFDDAAEPRPEVAAIMHLVCWYHQTRSDAPLAPFAPYEIASLSGPRGPTASSDHAARSVNKLRAIVVSWGVQWSRDEVGDVLKSIDNLRQIWENPTFRDLHRPVQGSDRNRADFLLDQPSFVPPQSDCDHKKWMEGGQRVVKRLLEELQSNFPSLSRPHDRRGRRDLQKDFHVFYTALRAAEELLDEADRSARERD
jgi:hypothetical protein